jgi:hypothetical protein
MKQLQRLLVVDAEAPPEPGAVLREAVFDLGTQATKPLAQVGDLRAEIGEVGRDGQLSLCTDKKARRLALGVLDPNTWARVTVWS